MANPNSKTKKIAYNANVKALQEELIKNGFSVGKYGADGKMGDSTSEAYKKAISLGYLWTNGKLTKATGLKGAASRYKTDYDLSLGSLAKNVLKAAETSRALVRDAVYGKEELLKKRAEFKEEDPIIRNMESAPVQVTKSQGAPESRTSYEYPVFPLRTSWDMTNEYLLRNLAPDMGRLSTYIANLPETKYPDMARGMLAYEESKSSPKLWYMPGPAGSGSPLYSDISKGIQRVITYPVNRLLDNLYPFGYDNSTASKNATNFFSNFMDETTSSNLGSIYGGFSKITSGIYGRDKAGDAANEFVDLDLTDPDLRARAQELIKIMKEAEPEYGPRFDDIDRALYIVRGRKDLNYLHTGRPLRWGTYIVNPEMTTDDEIVYMIADPEKRRQELEYVRNAMKNTTGSKVLDYDPYLLHGHYTAVAPNGDERGYYYDLWDYGFGKDIDTNLLPGMKKIKVGGFY